MSPPDPEHLRAARAAAAILLSERGYVAEAAIVAAGEGDDYVEVRTALALIPILTAARVAPPPARFAGRRLVGEEC